MVIGDFCVALHSGAFGAFDGAFAEARGKFFLRYFFPFIQFWHLRALPQLRLAAGESTFMIPRAHFLASITTKNPIAKLGRQFRRRRFAVFDGMKRNAPVRIQLVRLQRVRRTGVDARRASSAIILPMRLVKLQRQIHQDLAQQKIRSQFARDYQCVLSRPADARALCQLAFQNRPGVHINASGTLRLLLHPMQ